MGQRPPCAESVHVIPVPSGMTASESWEEISTLGRLAAPQSDPEWAVIECPGGDECRCRFIDRAPGYRRWHNDVLMEGDA